MSKIERIPDLSFRALPDGSLELEQGFTETHRISLHSCQVRLLFEKTGHLLPADELSKRLARQLCEVLRDLCDQSGLHPVVDRAITTLAAYRDALPESVFPHELYPDDEQPADTSQAFTLVAQEAGQ